MMTFRNSDIIQVSPMRELLRGNGEIIMPTGRDGFVIEDLDLLIRWYGSRFSLDKWGRYRLCELKHDTAQIGWAQKMTFALLDINGRTGEMADRYDGYYQIQVKGEHIYTSKDGHDVYGHGTTFVVNGTALGVKDFCDWCLSPVSEIERMVFPVPEWLQYTEAA